MLPGTVNVEMLTKWYLLFTLNINDGMRESASPPSLWGPLETAETCSNLRQTKTASSSVRLSVHLRLWCVVD